MYVAGWRGGTTDLCPRVAKTLVPPLSPQSGDWFHAPLIIEAGLWLSDEAVAHRRQDNK